MKTNDSNNKSQEGSGSAENRLNERADQKNSMRRTDQQERERIAAETGTDRKNISDIEDLGGLSGRDDSSGGSGDDMHRQNTNQPTDR